KTYAAYHTSERDGSTSETISAAMCLSAWNDPIGRPNCWRTFEYSTAISSARAAPPRLSAAMPSAPRSRRRARSGQPAPSRPRSALRSTATSRRWTSPTRRVRSMVSAGRTRTPGALVSTRNSDTAFRPVRAATSSSSAPGTPMTKSFVPARRQPSRVRRAASAMPSASWRSLSSRYASAAKHSPDARRGSHRLRCAAEPAGTRARGNRVPRAGGPPAPRRARSRSSCPARLARHAEPALGDDVLLDLRGAAADDEAERVHEVRRPHAAVAYSRVALVERPVRAQDVQRRARHVVVQLGRDELVDRRRGGGPPR